MDCCEKRENFEIIREKNSKKCREYWIVVKSEKWDKVSLKKEKEKDWCVEESFLCYFGSKLVCYFLKRKFKDAINVKIFSQNSYI